MGRYTTKTLIISIIIILLAFTLLYYSGTVNFATTGGNGCALTKTPYATFADVKAAATTQGQTLSDAQLNAMFVQQSDGVYAQSCSAIGG